MAPESTIFCIRCPICNAVWGEVNVRWAQLAAASDYTRKDGTHPVGGTIAIELCTECGAPVPSVKIAQLKARAWAENYRQQRALHSLPPSPRRH